MEFIYGVLRKKTISANASYAKGTSLFVFFFCKKKIKRKKNGSEKLLKKKTRAKRVTLSAQVFHLYQKGIKERVTMGGVGKGMCWLLVLMMESALRFQTQALWIIFCTGIPMIHPQTPE